MNSEEVKSRISYRQNPLGKCSVVENNKLCAVPAVIINFTYFPKQVPQFFKDQIAKAGFKSFDGSCCTICTNHLWKIIQMTLYQRKDKISYTATKKGILLFLKWNGVEDCVVEGLDESFKFEQHFA